VRNSAAAARRRPEARQTLRNSAFARDQRRQRGPVWPSSPPTR